MVTEVAAVESSITKGTGENFEVIECPGISIQWVCR